MKHARTGFRIWFLTVSGNAVFWLVAGTLEIGLTAIPLCIVAFVVGCFITLPFLYITIKLLQVTAKIPYRFASRLAWLTTVLLLLIFLLYGMVAYWINGSLFAEELQPWESLTGLACLLAVWMTRERLHAIWKEFPAGTARGIQV